MLKGPQGGLSLPLLLVLVALLPQTPLLGRGQGPPLMKALP